MTLTGSRFPITFLFKQYFTSSTSVGENRNPGGNDDFPITKSKCKSQSLLTTLKYQCRNSSQDVKKIIFCTQTLFLTIPPLAQYKYLESRLQKEHYLKHPLSKKEYQVQCRNKIFREHHSLCRFIKQNSRMIDECFLLRSKVIGVQ